MTVQFKSYQSESEGIGGIAIVFSDGNLSTLVSTHPNYAEILRLLATVNPVEIDEEKLFDLTQPGISAGTQLQRLSERVTFANNLIYFDGDEVDGAIASHIVRIIREGGDALSYASLVAFLEKMSQNPSEKSRSSLYDFIVRHSITIDPDGDFYVYKGVTADGKSIHSGFGIVDGVPMRGQLPNQAGSVIEMPRSQVDADTAVGCSTGLHAGTYGYASSFSRGMLLLVKVNPRDVVSVPDDVGFKKIRTSRYKVIETIVHEITSTTHSTDFYGDNDFESYENDVSGIEDALADNREVTVEFNYTRGDGSVSRIADFAVREFIVSADSDKLILGVRDNETRTYRVDRISDLDVYVDGVHVDELAELAAEEAEAEAWDYDNDEDFYDDGQDEETDEVETVSTDEDDYVAIVRDLLADSTTVKLILAFDYVRNNGNTAHIEGFTVTEVRNSRERGHYLFVGGNANGSNGSYRVDRITNLLAEADTTPAVTVSALTIADLVETIETGDEPVISFNYTKVDGTPRTVENFSAFEVTYSYQDANEAYLIIGEREDGETRSYRADRITNLRLSADDEQAATASSNPVVNNILGNLGN